jgi:High potential iron-sulfur protein
MKYQEQPKDGQRCDACMQFVPGPKPGAKGACKVVDGPISPSGWCIAFVKKS